MPTKPMTPEMLQEIQEFPDSMGMGHLVREVERCWEEVAELKGVIEDHNQHLPGYSDQFKAANAVCDHLQRDAIDGEELGRLLDAYRATQKGGE